MAAVVLVASLVQRAPHRETIQAHTAVAGDDINGRSSPAAAGASSSSSPSLPPVVSPASWLAWLWSSVSEADDAVLSADPDAATPGQWVDCPWIEAQFGTAEAMQRLRTQLQLNHTIDPRAPTHAALVSLRSAILQSVGIQCDNKQLHQRAAAMRNGQQGITSSSVAPWLHQWMSAHEPPESIADAPSVLDGSRTSASATLFALAPAAAGRGVVSLSSLPLVSSRDANQFGGALSFNVVSGALAWLSCAEQKLHAGDAFSDRLPRSAFVPQHATELSTHYEQFVRDDADDSPATAAAAFATGFPASMVRLFPSLPPACSLSSFFRPASARRCLANQRIIGLGDSTMQELMQHLVDLLETPDDGEGGDPDALSWTTPNQRSSAGSSNRSTGVGSGSASPFDLSRPKGHHLFSLDSWSDVETCWLPAERSSHAEFRSFSTARLPSPYLAAYNITVTMRFNVAHQACRNFEPAEAAMEPSLWKAVYRMMRDSCLDTKAAIAFAQRIRRGDFESDPARKAQLSSGTVPMSRHEYILTANAHFPYMHQTSEPSVFPGRGPVAAAPFPGQAPARDGRPGFSCAARPSGAASAGSSSSAWLSDAALAAFPASDAWSWYAPLSLLPACARFDVAVFVMGPHYLRSWPLSPVNAAAPMRSQFRAALRLTNYFARHVMVKELNNRDGAHHWQRVQVSAMLRRYMHTMQAQQAIRIARRAIVISGEAINATQWAQLIDDADNEQMETSLSPSPSNASSSALAAPSFRPPDALLIWPGEWKVEQAILRAVRGARDAALAANRSCAVPLELMTPLASLARSASPVPSPSSLSWSRASWLPEFDWTRTNPHGLHCSNDVWDAPFIGSPASRSPSCLAVVQRMIDNICSRK